MWILGFSFCAFVPILFPQDAVAAGVDLYSNGPNQWFNSELYLQNDQQEPEQYLEHKRFKRSYGGSYQSKGYESHNYGSGSYGSNGGYKTNQGYQNGAQLGLQCFALARTATNKWCYDNCLMGFCPKSVCSCTGEVYSQALKPTYTNKYTTKYGQTGYGQSSYGNSGSYGGSYGGSNYQKPSYGKTSSYGDSYQTSNLIQPHQGQYVQQKTEY